MNYYKIKFSDQWEDDNGDSFCIIDYRKARKDLGEKNKAKAVTVYDVVGYAAVVAMVGKSEAGMRQPKYLKTELTFEEVGREISNTYNNLLEQLKKMCENA